MSSLGFIRCDLDHAFYSRTDNNEFAVVGVYVDGLIITGTSASMINRFKH
jgi:hypothetical protein